MVFLAGDNPLHQIANRQYAHDLVALQHWKMTNVMVGHDRHAVVHGLLASYKDNRAGHDLADRGFLRVTPLKDDFAGVVALGKNSHQLTIGNDKQSSHPMLGHPFNGLIHGLLGSDRQNCVAGFLRENGVNFVTKTQTHGSTWWVVTLSSGYLTSSWGLCNHFAGTKFIERSGGLAALSESV